MKLGTIFSGIGAIEWALKRLHKKHVIEFACDNGNIEINLDYNKELLKVKSLNCIEDKRKYVENLYKSLSKKKNFVEISYKANYQIDDNRFFYDVKLFDGNDFKNKIDLLVGGSPCQSFSAIGQQGGFDDTRGTLFYEFARIVKESKPKVFIYENVYGVLKHDKGKTWNIMKNTFNELGYFFKYEVLDSRDFNIPQGRRRIFVVGFKDKKYFNNFCFPNTKKLQYRMQDFLIDNASVGNFLIGKDGLNIIKSNGIVDEKLFLSDKLKKYVLSPGTKKFIHNDAKTDLEIARAILSTQGNSHRASVNNYVTTNGKLRALDPRESLRLMGFTDEFKIVVSKAQSYKQSGNSIVVDVLIAILEEIYKTKVFKENI